MHQVLHYAPCKGYIEVVSRSSPIPRLQDLAQEQWGLLTRRQVEDAGIGATTFERLTGQGGALERVARGVYQFAAAPVPDHRDLRAAWLQLAPEVPAWERTPDQGIVSHRSAAALHGLGHLPADTHEFTLARRKQTRRPDVRLHVRPVSDSEWTSTGGMPVTTPPRIAADLLRDNDDPEAVAQLIREALRNSLDRPSAFVEAIAPYSASFGFRRADGPALLRWLLGLAGDARPAAGSTKPEQARLEHDGTAGEIISAAYKVLPEERPVRG